MEHVKDYGKLLCRPLMPFKEYLHFQDMTAPDAPPFTIGTTWGGSHAGDVAVRTLAKAGLERFCSSRPELWAGWQVWYVNITFRWWQVLKPVGVADFAIDIPVSEFPERVEALSEKSWPRSRYPETVRETLHPDSPTDKQIKRYSYWRKKAEASYAERRSGISLVPLDKGDSNE